MGVPYKDAGFELKFLGVMNGMSDSHTNAYFCPDDETLVFIDMSLYNYKKATKLIDERAKVLRRVILFLTHMHVDHASGVVSLAYYVRGKFPDVRLEVVAGSYYVQDAYRMFYAESARPMIGRGGRRDEIMRIFGWALDKKILVRWGDSVELLVGQELIDEQYQFKVPEWFIKAIPTTHSPRLSGASGFVFELNGKFVVYSGDTDTVDHFLAAAENYAAMEENRGPIVELYLDMEMNAVCNHPRWDNTRAMLLNFVRRARNVRIVLIHYDDAEALAREVELFNAESGEQSLFMAEEA
ncbi:hypothetical protein IKG20_02925 [Candidatus Saccharibacteria bacterium]|nr:hypothetical protein [Candidatus Saccharibacteria bacterium]